MPKIKNAKAVTQTKTTGGVAPPATPPPEVGTAAPTPATATAPGTSGVIDQPPTEPMPVAPVGFSVVNPDEFRGQRPRAAQAASAPVVAIELSGSTDYEARFGKKAPSQATVVAAVVLATRWRTVRTAIEAYLVYVMTQDALAWKAAMTLMRQLAPLFEGALKLDPTVATEYPGLTRFFEAPEVITKIGAATRVKHAKAKATEQAETEVSNAVNAALAQQATAASVPVAAPEAPVVATSSTSSATKKRKA
jgi:hypothetical protein